MMSEKRAVPVGVGRKGIARTREFYEEREILVAQERIAEAIEAKGLSRADVARRLGCSRAHVTQILRTGKNLTVRTLGGYLWAINEAKPRKRSAE